MPERRRVRIAFWLAVTVLGISLAQAAGGREKLIEGQLLARLLPLRWLEMPLMAEKDFGLQQIAQLEVTYARADYVSADELKEASIEITDTLHSPMHLNAFSAEQKAGDSPPADSWKQPGLQAYLLQDIEENESRAHLLIHDRYLIRIAVSPRVDNSLLRREIDAWLLEKGFRDILKYAPPVPREVKP